MGVMRTRLPLLLLSVWAFRAEAGCDTPCCARSAPTMASVAEKAVIGFYSVLLLPAEIPWSIVRGAQAVRGACTVVGGFVDGFSEPVGYAEAILPRYPVSPYQCDVSSGLRRGSRVGDDGLRGLKERQFRSIVNLNSERPRDNRSVAAEAGLHYL